MPLRLKRMKRMLPDDATLRKCPPGADPGVEIGGGHMASAEREPIMGGCAPSGVQGQSPWSGDQGAKPPEAERFLVLSYV